MHRTLPPCLFDLWDEEVKLSFMDNTGCYKNLVTMKSGCFMGQKDEVSTHLSLGPFLVYNFEMLGMRLRTWQQI